jgi:hypothetical protein
MNITADKICSRGCRHDSILYRCDAANKDEVSAQQLLGAHSVQKGEVASKGWRGTRRLPLRIRGV